MADGGQILDSKKNVTVNGRVSPMNGQYYSGITVELIQIKDNEEFVCGSGVTDSNGYYNFTGRVYYIGGIGKLFTHVGNDCSSIIDLDKIGLEFTVDDSFETYSDTPFTTDNILIVDYGDGSSLGTYSTGKLSHTYASSGNYNVSIFGEITQLNERCFRECSSLTSITIPNTVTTLRNHCFFLCTGLTSITIPNSVTTLGAGCFRRCTGLTSITISNTVTTLGTSCFAECRSLTSITIPNTVTTLGDGCFVNCSSLTSIQLNWDSANSIIAYNSGWIYGCSSFDHFLIPQGTTSLYVAKGYPSSLLVEEGSTPFDDISVSSSKDILSYADGDSTILSAQLTNQGQAVSVSGESVTFEVRKQSDDSLVETLTDTTDNTGLASVQYFGKGTGDLYISVLCRTLSKTYSIEDCIRYDSNTYNATQLLLYPLESTFKIEYETLITTTSNNSCYIGIGEDTTTSISKSLLVGKVGSADTQYKIYARNGGDVITTGSNIQTSNDFQDNVITYDGTELVFNNDIRITNFNGISLDKIVHFSTWKSGTTSGQVRNIKLKPL